MQSVLPHLQLLQRTENNRFIDYNENHRGKLPGGPRPTSVFTQAQKYRYLWMLILHHSGGHSSKLRKLGIIVAPSRKIAWRSSYVRPPVGKMKINIAIWLGGHTERRSQVLNVCLWAHVCVCVPVCGGKCSYDIGSWILGLFCLSHLQQSTFILGGGNLPSAWQGVAHELRGHLGVLVKFW